jgi:salicylate hydroxylase
VINHISHNTSLRVAIIGGGIGGLCTAAFLCRTGAQVSVFEKSGELREEGAGLMVAPNASRVLRHLGLADSLREVASVLETGWEYRRWHDGSVLSSQDLKTHARRTYGEDAYVLHRGDLLEILRSVVPDEVIHTGMRCVHAEQGKNSVSACFDDGSEQEFDVLIGADGVYSSVRDLVVMAPPIEYTGMCVWRTLIPTSDAPAFARNPSQTVWLGPGRHIVHYPISDGRLLNTAFVTPAGQWHADSWEPIGTAADLLLGFEGWHDGVLDLILAGTEFRRWPLLDTAPLSDWVKGRIGLLGDAAHPMYPLLAQGAAQALEDAAVLANCLCGLGPDDVDAALMRYQQMRMSRVDVVQQRSRDMRRHHHLPDGPEQQSRDRLMVEQDSLVNNSWLYGFDAVTSSQESRSGRPTLAAEA